MKKKWNGEVPKLCQLCKRPLKVAWIDGKTSFGPWAHMCVACHSAEGGKLGTGKGQKYDLATREKIEG